MPKSGGEIPVPFAKELNDLVRRLVAAAKEAGREEALAQIRAIAGGGVDFGNGRRRRGGRGRPAKSATAKPARRKSSKPRRNPWASLSPEARLKRVNAIRKGRGLPLKEKL